ncbi:MULTISPECIES: hypothetical protein [Aquimarina]|uniref:hypothetical protein n=1 Tax=Aquimarina TaxID=290174 RepID=UPI000CDE6ED7|nr:MULTISPECIES: hypothetical protein [Aquimarina]
MKIKTQEDVDSLDIKIQNELGIDLKKYRNPEVVENIMDLLLFPKYILNWTMRPVLISFVIYIIGYFIIDLVHIEYILYAIIGLVLFLITGVLAGLWFLTFKLKSDINAIIQYTLDILKSCVVDISKLSTNNLKENPKDTLQLLMKGITHIITIPVLTDVISKKIPLIGRLINSIIKRILISISNKLRFKSTEDTTVQTGEMTPSQIIEFYTKAVMGASNGLSTVLSISTHIVQLPIKISFGIIFSILMLFIYLIW